MTEKQKSILDAALKLFASQGFDAVSTNAIAKSAGVSEGLIFRHFESKAGLLAALMEAGTEKILKELSAIATIENPAERVHAIMEIPFHISPEDYPFWRLVYSLKWQNEMYDAELGKPLRDLLLNALTALKYQDPNTEADLILSYLDGFATTILLKSNSVNKDKLLAVLRQKYTLN
ncbi:MAG: hypothetical protein RLZZ337_1620 [Bacteroidota bacterium]|jgi:AcrR family transcriptional regulator